MPANFPSKKHPAYVGLVDDNGNQLGTQENPIYTVGSVADGSVTTDTIQDGAVTTPKIADGAVTDAKLAKPKVDVPSGIQPKMVLGTTLSTNVIGMVGYSQDPMADQLVMYNFGGQAKTADPVDDNDAASKKYVDNKTFSASAITSGTFAAARIPSLPQSQITNLTTDLAAKLTASKAAAQADSTATDVAGLVTDFNALLAKLRTAGILAT
ncbi:head fiber protein [Mycobacterium tuberculosis]|uniref:head fiber protein n=1 Tax=Mycobacterium tuberculosis TaxID=1773 RepID=UPI0018CC25F3|nr:head fiber protein [Mycobacterium tuberculosis]